MQLTTACNSRRANIIGANAWAGTCSSHVLGVAQVAGGSGVAIDAARAVPVGITLG